MNMPRRPGLAALWIADPADRWAALGFAVDGSGRFVLDGVTVHLNAPGRAISRWAVTGIDAEISEVDGLPTDSAPSTPARGTSTDHPNGAIAIDHVVVITPDSTAPRPRWTGSACRFAGSATSRRPATGPRSGRAFAGSDRRSSSSSRRPRCARGRLGSTGWW